MPCMAAALLGESSGETTLAGGLGRCVHLVKDSMLDCTCKASRLGCLLGLQLTTGLAEPS